MRWFVRGGGVSGVFSSFFLSFICTLVCYSHAFSYTPFDGAVLTTFL